MNLYKTTSSEVRHLASDVDDICIGNISKTGQHFTYIMFSSQVTDLWDLTNEGSRNPTVAVGFFVTRAYLANLYYTKFRHYIEALNICNEILRIRQRSFGNILFSGTLPVILTTEWIECYDKEIQQLLGFYTLVRSFLNKSHDDSPLIVVVCPVLFVLYLKYRLLIKLMKNSEDNREVHKVGNQIMDHPEGQTNCYICANYTKIFILRAINLSSMKYYIKHLPRFYFVRALQRAQNVQYLFNRAYY